MPDRSFETRRLIDEAKLTIRSKYYAGKNVDWSLDPRIYEYRSEVEHYRAWLETGEDSISLHSYAASLGLLDNMKLAERLMEIEGRLDGLDGSDDD